MEVQLKTFLERAKVNKGDIFTHTTKGTGAEGGWSSGSYYIPKDHINNFMILYCNAVKAKCHLTITEKPGPFCPLRVDFDFKSDYEVGIKRQYTENILKRIVEIYQEEIKKIVHPDAFNENMLWCMVLEKPTPRKEDGIIKDGFHLHFPYFICEEWLQDNYLRERAVKVMIDEKLWDKCKFKTPISDIIDKKIAGKAWMMYGSMNYKNNKSVPYIYNKWKKTPPEKKYGHAFNHNLQEITIGEMFCMQMLDGNKKNKARYYLPVFLSVRGYTSPTQIIDSVCSKKIFKKTTKKLNVRRRRNEEDVLEDIKMITDGGIMDMLSNDRADDYNDWMDVGWTLFNIGEGRDETLQMWIEFSKRSSKFTEGVCENVWNGMQLSEKSIASLLYMAKLDSPDDYQKWKESNIRFFLFKSLECRKPNEYDISLVVAKMFGDKFLCADARRGIWFYYEDHRWNPMDDEIQLKRKLVNDVLNKYGEILFELGLKIAEVEHRIGMLDKDSEDSKKYTMEFNSITNKKKKCLDIMDGIKQCDFQKKIVNMCKLHMHNSKFLVKMNENKNYIGCENGVIDLELGIFREGRPDDYITFSTGQHFTDYNQNDEEVKELEEYLIKVYPNKNIREYFLDFIATSLKGNINKRFGIFTGPSDGAKSMTFTLLETAFGNGSYGYFGKFPREMLVQTTTKNSSSSSRPELARVRGKKFMATQEITKMEKINIGFIKESTGNDSIYVRSHYEQGTEIKPNFTLLMACNEPPEIPGHDEATWSRIRVIDHEAKFVKPQDLKKYPVPESFDEQLKIKRFKADPAFGERIPDLANVMLWMLFQRFKKCSLTKELYEPKEVLLSTEKYQNDNDVYRRFYADKIEKVQDGSLAKKSLLKLQDVFMLFKEWYKEEYPSYRDIIGKGTFKNELNKKMGVIKQTEDIYGFDDRKNGWMGYRFIQDEEFDLEFSSEN